MKSISKSQRFLIIAICAVTIPISVVSMPKSAFADPIVLDATGVSFSFIETEDVLSGSTSGDYFEYENVATIGDITINATLTVTQTFNLIDYVDTVFYDQALVDYLNSERDTENPGSEDLLRTGCYIDITEVGQPSFAQHPEEWLTGSDIFNSSTAFSDGSDFLSGSVLRAADEVIEDSVKADSAINTEILACGGAVFSPEFTEYIFPGYARLSIEFFDAATDLPVTLVNFNISAYDIDAGQYIRFFDPLPDSFEVFDKSLLEICGPAPLVASSPCTDEGDYAGDSDFLEENPSLEFYGEDSSEEGEINEWAGVARYTTPTSQISYQFGVKAGGGGSLEVRMDDIDWTANSKRNNDKLVANPADAVNAAELANTGLDGNLTRQTLGVVMLISGAGALFIFIGYRRRLPSNRVN